MKSITSPLWILCIVLAIGIPSCYPTYEMKDMSTRQFKKSQIITAATKVCLKNATVAVFEKGFEVGDSSVTGECVLYSMAGAEGPQQRISIPFHDIATLSTFESHMSVGRAFGGFIHFVWGTSITALAIECLACPKCCFGSCPTVYSVVDNGSAMQCELFSSSVSSLMEADDLDQLVLSRGRESRIELKVTNEALETHYINRFSLLKVNHPRGTFAFPSNTNSIVLIKDLVPLTKATNRASTDIKALVAMKDTNSYRTNCIPQEYLVEGKPADWIDCSVQVPEGATNAFLVVRAKNSLLSTVLFYELVLASQGWQAVEWLHRMDTDTSYAKLFRSVYAMFSGITVKAFKEGRWVTVGKIGDSGPISWKETAIQVPAQPGEHLTCRLEFFPDNYIIDRIQFGFSDRKESSFRIEEQYPLAIRENSGELRPDVAPLLVTADDRYLVTEPGESYRLTYDVAKDSASEETFFIQSRGWYREWIRAGWLQTPRDAFFFDLLDVEGTVQKLAEHWQADRVILENEFFRTRIPIAEAK